MDQEAPRFIRDCARRSVTWSAKEAALLMCGIDPAAANLPGSGNANSETDETLATEQVIEDLARDEGVDNLTPVGWLDWITRIWRDVREKFGSGEVDDKIRLLRHALSQVQYDVIRKEIYAAFPLPTENTVLLGQFNAFEPDWEKAKDFERLEPEQAIPLANGLRLSYEDGVPDLRVPPRLTHGPERSKAEDFFVRVKHQLGVAKNEGLGKSTPAEWGRWFRRHGWDVHSRFCLLAGVAQEESNIVTSTGGLEPGTNSDGQRGELDDARNSSLRREKQKSEKDQGVSTKEVIDKFGLDTAWQNKLSHIDRFRYLLPAVIVRGSRKRAGKGTTPHEWDPAYLGWILIQRDVKVRSQVNATLTMKFPKWLERWEQILSDNNKEEENQ